MPRVSVVTSVYNGEAYLEECVDSILNQTFQDFEYIILDNGSTDRTPEILAHRGDGTLACATRANAGSGGKSEGCVFIHTQWAIRMAVARRKWPGSNGFGTKIERALGRWAADDSTGSER